MPTPAPIQGITNLVVGGSTTLTDATVGGTWSSDNTAVATINASTGVVTAIGAGAANIIYTVGSDSIAARLTVTLNTVTNGLNYDSVYDALKNRVLWQQQGVTSDSRRYYEDFHTLNDTSILIDLQNDDSITDVASPAFAELLNNRQRSIVFEALNAVYNAPQLIDKAKLCFQRPDVMLYPQPVVNQNQFVGIKMLIVPGEDIAVRFSNLELFFDSDVTFNMYLYNDMTLPPIYTKSVTASAMQQVIVDLSNDAIMNYLTPAKNKGGIFYFGYYQRDLGTARAMYYSIYNTQFHGCQLWAFSAPEWNNSPIGGRNFQRNNIGANNLTYGLNIEVSTYVDATNNIVQNVNLLDEVIGNVMTVRIIKDLIFSYRSGSTQRQVQGNAELGKLYAELNGFKADDEIPYIAGFKDVLNRSIKTAKAGFQKHRSIKVGIAS
jgi:hypothetical protein